MEVVSAGSPGYVALTDLEVTKVSMTSIICCWSMSSLLAASLRSFRLLGLGVGAAVFGFGAAGAMLEDNRTSQRSLSAREAFWLGRGGVVG